MSDTINHFAHQLSAMATVGDEHIDKAMLTPAQRHHLELCIETMHSTASFLMEPHQYERKYRSADDTPQIEHSQAGGLGAYLAKQSALAA